MAARTSIQTTSAKAAARLSYLGISAICRRYIGTSTHLRNGGTFHRSDFTGHGYTGFYETGPTEGPLKDASNIGVPRITPRSLKEHLDQFVVGQERAKKVLSVAVYNHYQRIQELERQDEEFEEALAQQARKDRSRDVTHPLEGKASLYSTSVDISDTLPEEFPGQQRTVGIWDPNARTHSYQSQSHPPPGSGPVIDASPPMAIEKSNIMLLGPSGTGKTLMAKTLARVLEVPFSMSDCTPFTQAGYIGEDADVCVQRLLAAANYDVTKAERGIIVLDEIDKIATAKVSHGKDVSGEGVQQALLKIIEGTTLQVQAKSDRTSGGPGRNKRNGNDASAGGVGNNPSAHPPQGNSGGKPEIYDVRTDNILFICTGAFIGLHKLILDRISKGSIGFNAPVRSSPSSASPSSDPNDTLLPSSDAHLFHANLPFYSPPPPPSSHLPHSTPLSFKKGQQTYNSLDLLTPPDLTRYGLLPELVGRLPITCALSPLSVEMLVQVLTEPRNSLLKQYEQLFALSSIELRLTTPALHAVAGQAAEMATGARGLRTVMERVLGDAMFECPGSSVRHVAVTEAVVKRERGAWYFGREERAAFGNILAREEEEWEERKAKEEQGDEADIDRRARNNSVGGAATTFEEYRAKAQAAGFG